MHKLFYTYIVECNDKTLYTGYTTDVEARIKTHNSGKGAKYTKARLPVDIVYYEEFEDKIEAMRREYAIKKLTRKEKLLLIKKPLTIRGCKWYNDVYLDGKYKSLYVNYILK